MEKKYFDAKVKVAKLSQKKIELIGYRMHRAKTIGYMLWPIAIIVGLVSWILFYWYILFLVLFVFYLFGACYSFIETKRIQKMTGLNVHEQKIAFSESAIGRKDPISQDRVKYREYIDSLPDL